MQKNKFFLPRNIVVPVKETLDYAKNVALCITLQTVAITIGSHHAGSMSPRWFWILFASVLTLATGVLSAMTAQHYFENWDDLSERSRWKFTIANILIVFAAGMAVKVRLAEGW